MKKAILQAVNGVDPHRKITSYNSGIMSWVAPPPMFPHPAAVPLTSPIILLLNIVLIQYWHDTKVARQNPIMNRTVMYPEADDTNAMQKTVGADSMMTNAHPYRGPNRSQTAPIMSLEKMLPEVKDRKTILK